MLRLATGSKASISILAAAVAGAAAAFAAPAFAQSPAQPPTAGEVVVTGRYQVGPNVRSLSAPVSYSDLDLTTEAGRNVLQQRVKATAHDLCLKLGEAGEASSPVLPSCEQGAINSAGQQEQMAFAQARPAYAAMAPQSEPYVAPAGPNAAAAAAPAYGQAAAATVTTQTVTNGPIPDTPQNRARYGGPLSASGRLSPPRGN